MIQYLYPILENVTVANSNYIYAQFKEHSISLATDSRWSTCPEASPMGSYFNINEFLVEDERLPCVFNEKAVGMGMLDPSQEDEDLPSGSKVELPLWLGSFLAKRHVIKINQPYHYSAEFREQLNAASGAVDLRDHSNNYYKVGGAIARITDDKQLENLLLDVFTGERFKKLLDYSLNSVNVDMIDYTRVLPVAEKTLYDVGYCCSFEDSRWKSREYPSRRRAASEPNAKRRRHH